MTVSIPMLCFLRRVVLSLFKFTPSHTLENSSLDKRNKVEEMTTKSPTQEIPLLKGVSTNARPFSKKQTTRRDKLDVVTYFVQGRFRDTLPNHI